MNAAVHNASHKAISRPTSRSSGLLAQLAHRQNRWPSGGKIVTIAPSVAEGIALLISEGAAEDPRFVAHEGI